MSTAPQPDDLVHDEHLRAALRYAPDHGLTPPSSVTQAILAAAREVHRPVRRAAPPAPVRAAVAGGWRWRELLRFLGSPRWAGGFATGLVAALVVGLWIDDELPTAVAPPQASTPVRSDTAEPSPAVGSVAETRAAAAPPAAVSTPAPARAPATSVPAAPPLRKPGIAESADPMAAVRDAAPAPTELGGGVEPARPASTARPREERAADELKPDRLGKTAAAGDPPERAPLPKAVPAPAAESAAPAAASPALTLLRRIRAESAVPSAQWTWQPPGAAAPRPVDADGEAWLLRLVQTARRRWVDVAVPSDAGGATEVRWWRDGEPHARLRIEAGGLRWLETSGRIRFAALEPHALERLRSY